MASHKNSPVQWLETLIAQLQELSDRSRTTPLHKLEEFKNDAKHCLMRLGSQVDSIRQELAKLEFEIPMPGGPSLEERRQEHYYRILKEAGRLLEDALHIARSPRPTSVSGPAPSPPVAPFPLATGAIWSDVSIRFTSEFQAQITVLGRTEVRNYTEMGFEDRRRQVPDSAWELLQKFAENGGIIRNSQQANGTPWPRVEKRVQTIRKRLRQLFQIPDDPFEPYHRVKCYKAKFRIEAAKVCQP